MKSKVGSSPTQALARLIRLTPSPGAKNTYTGSTPHAYCLRDPEHAFDLWDIWARALGRTLAQVLNGHTSPPPAPPPRKDKGFPGRPQAGLSSRCNSINLGRPTPGRRYPPNVSLKSDAHCPCPCARTALPVRIATCMCVCEHRVLHSSGLILIRARGLAGGSKCSFVEPRSLHHAAPCRVRYLVALCERGLCDSHGLIVYIVGLVYM